jgi:hypothetical protein
MSIGNTKDQGNKGNNFPYQLRTLQLLSSINDGISALPGVDYETRTTTYQATANGPGYSTGDIIVRYDIIDVATSTIAATIWFNQTTQLGISAPAAGNITPISSVLKPCSTRNCTIPSTILTIVLRAVISASVELTATSFCFTLLAIMQPIPNVTNIPVCDFLPSSYMAYDASA